MLWQDWGRECSLRQRLAHGRHGAPKVGMGRGQGRRRPSSVRIANGYTRTAPPTSTNATGREPLPGQGKPAGGGLSAAATPSLRRAPEGVGSAVGCCCTCLVCWWLPGCLKHTGGIPRQMVRAAWLVLSWRAAPPPNNSKQPSTTHHRSGLKGRLRCRGACGTACQGGWARFLSLTLGQKVSQPG